jgi:hypothetical protein
MGTKYPKAPPGNPDKYGPEGRPSEETIKNRTPPPSPPPPPPKKK